MFIYKEEKFSLSGTIKNDIYFIFPTIRILFIVPKKLYLFF